MKIRQASKIRGGRPPKRTPGRRKAVPWRAVARVLFRTTLMLALLAAVVGAGYGAFLWVTTTELLTLKEIRITGNSHLSEEAVKGLLSIPPDANLAALDMDRLRERLLSEPWVRDATLHRRMPHTLLVEIREHRPVAMARWRKRLFLVDEKGALFREVGAKERWRLPIITGLGPRSVKDRRLSQEAREVVKLLKLSERRPSTLGIGNIKEIKWVDGGGFLVYCGPLELHFGPGDIRHQFARAEQVLYHIYHAGLKDQIARVDLAYGDDLAWAKLKARRTKR